MRLYIIRHADPDYSIDSITEAGRLEAKALARRMKKQGLDRIYCSPLGRAKATMQYTADLLGMDYEIEDWTRELELRVEKQGFETSMAWDVNGEIIRGDGEFPDYDDWYTREPYTEAKYRERFEQVKKNSDAFLARHGYVCEGGRYRIERGNREQIAVFCHGGFGVTWLAHLLEIPLTMMWAGFTLLPTSVTTVLFDERSKQWAVPRCVGVGDVSHLYAEGLAVSTRGIKANCD